MKKFKLKRKKEPYPKNARVRVKNSYYTFSKEYPASKIIQTKRVKRKKERVLSALRIALGVVCFFAVMCLSFFAVSLGLNFSNKSIGEDAVFSSALDAEGESLLGGEGVKALYMPQQTLSTKRSLSAFVKKVKRKDCNAVVLDFKNDNGKLLYSSQNKLAKSGKCAVFDNETVKTALRTLQEEEIAVVARFFCFEDRIISETAPELAVKYKNTDVLWRDDIAEGAGKTWLNPYSKEATNYLLELLGEISSMGVSGFILESVSFPRAELSQAGFPGEKSENRRGRVLANFVEKAKKTVSKGQFVLVCESASAVLGATNETFYSDVLLANSNGLCVGTLERPETFVCDRRSGYSSMLSMLAQIQEKQSAENALLPVIDIGEYSKKYIRVLERSGYKSFILYDENGKY